VTTTNCCVLLEHDQLLAVRDLWRKTGRQMESTVTGDSMLPTLPEGARILIRAADQSEYLPGAVAACLENEFLFAHRIAYRGKGRRADFVVTQGDAWILCDPPVRTSNIIGIVDARELNGQWVPLPAPARSPGDARSARRHARAMGLYLRFGLGFARRMSRLLVKLYTYYNTARQRT
jgi:hypothetical protein